VSAIELRSSNDSEFLSYDNEPKQMNEENDSLEQTFSFSEDQAETVTENRVKGFVFFGIRLSNEFIQRGKFYSKLKLFTLDEIQKIKTKDDVPTSTFKISNQNDCARLGFITEWLITLVPVDEKKTINPYNSKYNTSIVSSTEVTPQNLKEILLSQRFPLGPEKNQVDYKILPNSIKSKRLRKNASTL
jgi:hypothetical protein